MGCDKKKKNVFFFISPCFTHSNKVETKKMLQKKSKKNCKFKTKKNKKTSL